jgi:hypothetical protein
MTFEIWFEKEGLGTSFIFWVLLDGFGGFFWISTSLLFT